MKPIAVSISAISTDPHPEGLVCVEYIDTVCVLCSGPLSEGEDVAAQGEDNSAASCNLAP